MDHKELLAAAKSLLEYSSKHPEELKKAFDGMNKAPAPAPTKPTPRPADSLLRDPKWHGSGHGAHELAAPVSGVHEMAPGKVYAQTSPKWKSKNMFKVTANHGDRVEGHFVHPQDFGKKRLPTDKVHMVPSHHINTKGGDIYHHLKECEMSMGKATPGETGHMRGVHWKNKGVGSKPGTSDVGMHIRTKSRTPADNRDAHRSVLGELKRMPAPKLPKAEVNPDEKQDAQLGEDVEHLVEDHFVANKAAEEKEGHKIDIRKEVMSEYKPRFRKDEASEDMGSGMAMSEKVAKASAAMFGRKQQSSIKGVHSPADRHSPASGASRAGDQARSGAVAPAVAAHKQKLQELRSMSAPKLPKAEMEKATDPLTGKNVNHITKNPKHRVPGFDYKKQHVVGDTKAAPKLPKAEPQEKGVHQQKPSHPGNVGVRPGMSEAGDQTRWAGATDKKTMPKSHAMHTNNARAEHHKILQQLAGMKAPNLPKSEIEKSAFDEMKNKLAHEKNPPRDPAAVAAVIGRKKYGAKGMAAKAKAGKKKGN